MLAVPPRRRRFALLPIQLELELERYVSHRILLMLASLAPSRRSERSEAKSCETSYVEYPGNQAAVDVLHRIGWHGFGASFLQIVDELLHVFFVDAQVLRKRLGNDVQVVDAFDAFVSPTHRLL